MSRSSRNLLIFAGIALLLLTIYLSRNSGHESIIQQQTGNESAVRSDNPNSTSTRPSRRRSLRQAKLPPSSHEYAKLKDFIIPELKLEQSTFKQALHDLRDHYYDVCQLTGEKPIHFKFVIHGTPIDPHTITITNRSFLKNLNILALLGGMKMTQERRIITLTAIDSLGSHETKTILVPPGISKKLAPRHQGTVHDEASKILKQLAHATKTELSLNPAKSTLTLSGDSLEIERIEALINQYIRTRPTQIRTMSKIITVSKEAMRALASSENQTIQLDEKSAQTFSAVETQMIMRGLAQTPGTDLVTAPSVLARPNEKFTIEVIQDAIFPSTTTEEEFTSDWTGFKITGQPSRLGFGIIPKLTFNRGVMNQSNNTDAPISIKHRVDTIENFIPANKTIMAPIQSDEGKTTYLFLTLEEIDAAGIKINR